MPRFYSKDKSPEEPRDKAEQDTEGHGMKGWANDDELQPEGAIKRGAMDEPGPAEDTEGHGMKGWAKDDEARDGEDSEGHRKG